MPIDCEYPEDDNSREWLDRQVQESLGLPSEWQEGYGTTGKETQETIRNSAYSPWDLLLTKSQRTKISNIDIGAQNTCHNLRELPNSDYAYYCKTLLLYYMGRGALRAKSPETEADTSSAEGLAMRNPEMLETYCVGNHCDECRYYKEEQS